MRSQATRSSLETGVLSLSAAVCLSFIPTDGDSAIQGHTHLYSVTVKVRLEVLRCVALLVYGRTTPLLVRSVVE